MLKIVTDQHLYLDFADIADNKLPLLLPYSSVPYFTTTNSMVLSLVLSYRNFLVFSYHIFIQGKRLAYRENLNDPHKRMLSDFLQKKKGNWSFVNQCLIYKQHFFHQNNTEIHNFWYYIGTISVIYGLLTGSSIENCDQIISSEFILREFQ